MTLDLYIQILKQMVKDQEALIKDNDLNDVDLAIEIGMQSAIELCLSKAEQIDTI